MKALIVDDSSINRKIVAKILEPYGNIEAAGDGQIGTDMFHKAHESGSPYNLICLDISMPGKDGHTVLKDIRNFEREKEITSPVPIIMITALSDRENVMRAHKFCQGYIIKPISPIKVRKKIESLGFIPNYTGFDSPDLSKDELAEIIKKNKTQTETLEKNLQHLAPLISEQNGMLAFFLEVNGSIIESLPDQIELFAKVKSGEVVAKVEKPDIDIELDNSLILSPSKGVIIASKSGKVIVDGRKMSIVSEMKLYETVRHKNIDFGGMVEIIGDVRDNVTIQGLEGIDIKGITGACTLLSDANINVTRMNGANRGNVTCGGIFKGELVYETTIKSNDEIRISKECVNSNIVSDGAVRVGVITGGECIATQLIQFDRAGSPQDVSTLLKVGVSYDAAEKISKLNKENAILEQSKRKLFKLLGPYAEDISLADQLDDYKKAKIISNYEEYTDVLDKISKNDSEIHELKINTSEGEIIANKIIYKGVTLAIGQYEEFLNEDIEGPVSITLNSDQNSFILTSIIPTPESAEKSEDTDPTPQ